MNYNKLELKTIADRWMQMHPKERENSLNVAKSWPTTDVNNAKQLDLIYLSVNRCLEVLDEAIDKISKI